MNVRTDDDVESSKAAIIQCSRCRENEVDGGESRSRRVESVTPPMQVYFSGETSW
jgi:hypothetical protein